MSSLRSLMMSSITLARHSLVPSLHCQLFFCMLEILAVETRNAARPDTQAVGFQGELSGLHKGKESTVYCMHAVCYSTVPVRLQSQSIIACIVINLVRNALTQAGAKPPLELLYMHSTCACLPVAEAAESNPQHTDEEEDENASDYQATGVGWQPRARLRIQAARIAGLASHKWAVCMGECEQSHY